MSKKKHRHATVDQPPAWTGKGKIDLMNSLAWVRENFILGMAMEDLIPKDVWTTLKTKHLMVHVEAAAPLSVSLADLSDKMRDEKVRGRILASFHTAHKRAASRESFELVYTYCKEKHQLPIFKAVPWLYFARMVRNTASHGRGGFIKWPKELTEQSITKVTWRHQTIDASQDGQELKLGANETFQLMLDLIDFAEKNVT